MRLQVALLALMLLPGAAAAQQYDLLAPKRADTPPSYGANTRPPAYGGGTYGQIYNQSPRGNYDLMAPAQVPGYPPSVYQAPNYGSGYGSPGYGQQQRRY